MIFYDYEAFQKDCKHIPNFICAKLVCVSCLDNLEKICKCENKEFTNNDSFCEWMFNLKGEHVALAHNFKSYDSSFIIEWI